MENYDINNCSVNDSYVVCYKDKKNINGEEKETTEYHTVTGEHLLLTFEGDLNAISYTKAVDKHIDRSIKFESYVKGYNDFIKDFENGNYDTMDHLESVYDQAVKIFHKSDISFVIVDGSIMQLDSSIDIVDKICTIFKNSLDSVDLTKYKYLEAFVNKMSKEKELIMK